jgi:preprotein translocase subunit SecE
MAGELEQNKKQNWVENTRAYLGDIRSEMKRVTWPSRKQVESTTVVVIVSVFIFAAYFKIVDSILTSTLVRVQAFLIGR